MTRAPGMTTLATERGERGMEITRTVEVYTLDELSEKARAKAVARMREKTEVYEGFVSEDVNDRFVELATGEDGGAFAESDVLDRFGVRIFWSVGYTQSDRATITGRLRRDTTPLLAWPDGVGGVDLDAHNGIEDYYGMDPDDWTSQPPAGSLDAVKEMVRGIEHELYDVAREACEDQTSEETVVMRYDDGIIGPKRRFLADGSEAPEAFWSDDEA